MSIPQNLKYTKDHEWVSLEGNVATVGITYFAQGELGDIVFLEINSVGETLNELAVFGTVEAVKTVSDLYMPLTGTVTELNTALDANPELINTDPYGNGWLVKVEVANPADFDALMSAADYEALVG